MSVRVVRCGVAWRGVTDSLERCGEFIDRRAVSLCSLRVYVYASGWCTYVERMSISLVIEQTLVRNLRT